MISSEEILNEALWEALSSKNIDNAKRSLEEGANVNIFKNDLSPMISSVQQGLPEFVKLLLDAGADVKAVNGRKCTALMLAAEKGSSDCMKLLLDAGSDANAVDGWKRTALMRASGSGSVDCVKLLLDVGAAVNAVDGDSCTALMRAAGSGSLDCVKLLLGAGADVNAVDARKCTALMLAAEKGSSDCMKLLLDAGSDANAVDGWKRTALMYAAGSGSADCVKLLLDVGAAVNAVDGDSCTALMRAAGSGSLDCVKLLLGTGADVNAVDARKCTALMLAADKGSPGSLKLLLDSGADANAVDRYKRSTLIRAAESGSSDCVKLLLDSGADVNSVDGDGRTSLMMAAEKGLTAGVQVLLDAGAAVNTVDGYMDTALTRAVEKESAACVKLLLDAGADVKAVNGRKCTALMLAAEKGSVDCVKLLLDAGSDANAVDKYGKTSLTYSAEAELDTVSLILVGVGAFHGLIDGVATVSPLFTLKKHRNLKEAICRLDFLTLQLISFNNFDIWTQVVQVDDVAGIEDIIRTLVTNHPELANARDAKGRLVVDIATPAIKFTINSVTLWFGKYRPAAGKPEHTSATCFVFKAMDESGEEPRSVALKLMRVKAQFKRETEMRKYEFDGDYVMVASESFPSDTVTDADPDVVDVSTTEESSGVLNKAQAEKLYCVVMPLADRNMFVAMKQERFAGKEDTSEVVTIFTQLVKCVMHMHSKGVLHSDIKPMNIVRMGGKWMLIDLDACCAIDRDSVGFKSSSAYVPPEAVYGDAAQGVVVVKSDSVCSKYGVTPLVAHESFDVWSLGCILYQLCSEGVLPLFAANQDDNLTIDLLNVENSLWSLCSWTDRLKEKKLSRVANMKARNLLSLMLTKDPLKRPSLSRVLGHPFLSGDNSGGRMAGDAAEFDVFISYRVWSDSKNAERLYEMLTAAGLKVWWDKQSLEAGKDWKSGFCHGLASSSAFVCILSEAGTDAIFQSLGVESQCDNLLLEHRLALELKQIDYVKYVFPIMMGGDAAYRGSRKESHSHVSAVEEGVAKYMSELGLGTPLKSKPSVHDIEREIQQCQGYFVDNLPDHSMEAAVQGIVKALQNRGGTETASLPSSKIVSSLRNEVNDNKLVGFLSLDEVESIRAQYEEQYDSLKKELNALLTYRDSVLEAVMTERDCLRLENQELKNKLPC